MDIEIRKLTVYQSVKLTDGATSIELGLLDKDEALKMARQFRRAAYELDPENEGSVQ